MVNVKKKYKELTGQEALPYKQGKGTRWETHQLSTIHVHIQNLATMLVFPNEQSETPYNNTMESKIIRDNRIYKKNTM